ncbi:MAG: hypothetical protein K2Z81_06710 [Cyanobacteria bacterium]|nr:hypothetical protein [Cyanobacteriota bacterium]
MYRNYESQQQYEEARDSSRQDLAERGKSSSHINQILEQFDACDAKREPLTIVDYRDTIHSACAFGSIETLAFMSKAFDVKFDPQSAMHAINNNQIKVVEYLHQNGLALTHGHAVRSVATDDVECLEFIHSKIPEMDFCDLLEVCALYGSSKCLKFIFELHKSSLWDDSKHLPLLVTNYVYSNRHSHGKISDKYEECIEILSDEFHQDYDNKVAEFECWSPKFIRRNPLL